MGILFNEEECSKEAVKSFLYGQFFWVFVLLWPIILLLFPHFTYPRTLPNMRAHLFAKMDSSTETNRRFDNTYYGVAPPPFLTPKEPFCTCVVGEVSLTSGVIDEVLIFLFQQSSVPAINFIFGVSRENKAPI